MCVLPLRKNKAFLLGIVALSALAAVSNLSCLLVLSTSASSQQFEPCLVVQAMKWASLHCRTEHFYQRGSFDVPDPCVLDRRLG